MKQPMYDRSGNEPLPDSTLGSGNEQPAPHSTPREAPDDIPFVMGLAKLATMQFRGQDTMETYRELAARLQEDNTNVAPLMDIAILDQFLGWPQRGLNIQLAALQAQRVYRLSCAVPAPRLRLVGFAMAGPINANTPIEFLIEDSDLEIFLVFIVPDMPVPEIPDHDLAIVLAAESEPGHAVLAELEALLTNWPRPVLNLPELVPLLGRESLYRLVEGIEGIEIPATVRVDAAAFAEIGAGTVQIESALPDGGFPIIARPVDSHGGKGLEKLETFADVAEYLARNPVPEYYLSRFVDYSSPDRYFRKYRIAVIDGVPFASHLAISSRWMIHFLNASMGESDEKRCEEAHFMDRFEVDFAARHGAALAEMAKVSGLEYFGVDCGETQDGKLLLFEADTSLIVHNMDSPVDFPYKDRHMRSLFAAFQAMLYRKAAISP